MLGLCSTCLSADRNVTLLKNHKKKSIFVDWIDAFSMDFSKTQFCWECHAMFVKIEKFKIQIHNAQSIIKVMEERKIKFNYHLSNLSIRTINTYDKQYEELDKENNDISASVTNNGTNSDSSVNEKSLTSNIWNIKDEDNIMCTTVDISNISTNINDAENDLNVGSNSIHIQEDDDIKIDLSGGPNVIVNKENSNIGIDTTADSNVGSNSVDIQEHDDIESDLYVGCNSHHQENDDIKTDLNIGRNFIYTKDSDIGLDTKVDYIQDNSIQEDNIETPIVNQEALTQQLIQTCYVPIVKLTDADLEKFGAEKRKSEKEIKDTCKTKLKVKHNDQAQTADLDEKDITSTDEDYDVEDGTESDYDDIITSKKPRINHQNTKDIKKHKCATCGRRFRRKYNLIHHELLHSDEKVNYCAVCDVSCSNPANLRIHLLSSKHMAISKGEKIKNQYIKDIKEHKCATCGRGFRAKYNLIQHELLHSNKKVNYCAVCDVSCSNPANLRIHLLSSKHMAISKGKIGVTPKIIAMKRPIELDPNKIRIITLSPEEQLKQREEEIERDSRKPYRCDICLKGFYHITSLENHMNTHEPSRGPHKCQVCHMYFRERRSLKRHSLTHTRRYECVVCKKRLISKLRIVEHVRNAHNYTIIDKRRPIGSEQDSYNNAKS